MLAFVVVLWARRTLNQPATVCHACPFRRHLGLGSYGEWPEEQRLQFLTEELQVGQLAGGALRLHALACSGG